jgi:aryl-alcohol dehydrogenase-like predicted oxidoreductase
METRVLGKSDLQITRIGVGAWAMGGGGWTWSWGPQDDQKSMDAIHAALEAGINWIDTAAVYGLGHSEEVIGRALKGRSSRPYIFTKCGRVWDERGNIGGSLKAESIRRECEASLRRLNAPVIDLSQRGGEGALHWRVEFQCSSNATRVENCSYHFSPASLFHSGP